jgi:hypothetical protein
MITPYFIFGLLAGIAITLIWIALLQGREIKSFSSKRPGY